MIHISRVVPVGKIVPSHGFLQGRFLSSTTANTTGTRASRRLYRILLRQCRVLEQQQSASSAYHHHHDKILLQPPLDPHRAGIVRTMTSVEDATAEQVLANFADRVQDDDLSFWLQQILGQDEYEVIDDDRPLDTIWASVSTIRTAVKMAFHHTTQLQRQLFGPTLLNQWAILAYQYLNEQLAIMECTSTHLEHNIRVTATSRLIGRSRLGNMASSDDDDDNNNNNDDDDDEFRGDKYRFSYRIRIENASSATDTVQLLGRTWLIEERDDPVRGMRRAPIRVHSPQTGAVGKLPVLQPGEAFEYMSGAELSTSTGTMKGCFHMARVPVNTPSAVVGMHVEAFHSPDRFEVPVAPFPLC